MVSVVLALPLGDGRLGFCLCVGDQLLGVRTRLGDHPVGLSFCVREDAIGVVPCILDRRRSFGVGAGDCLFSVGPGVTDQLVAVVQHVLGVVEFTGNGVAHIVEQFENIAAWDHTAGGHGHTACLFDNRDKFVERLENPVHEQPQSFMTSAGRRSLLRASLPDGDARGVPRRPVCRVSALGGPLGDPRQQTGVHLLGQHSRDVAAEGGHLLDQ